MQRVKAFDWLRGLAVLVMLQTHSMPLLKPELRSGWWHQFVNRIDGLVAPAFLLTAGFALALVSARASDRATRLKQLKRIGQVGLLAITINAIWFPISREPQWLFRMDILHCMALSLLLLWSVLWLTQKPAVFVVISFTLFLVAPFAERIGEPLNWLLNTSSTAQFPLMPWAAYVFGGAAFGLVTARQGSLNRWLLGAAVVGAAFWWLRPVLQPLYGQHDFWVSNISSCGHRWACVAVIALVFRALERRVTAIKPLEFFSTNSLSAYFVHEMLLFLWWPFSFERMWKGRLSWPEMLSAVVLLMALTALVLWVFERVQQKLQPRPT